MLVASLPSVGRISVIKITHGKEKREEKQNSPKCTVDASSAVHYLKGPQERELNGI